MEVIKTPSEMRRTVAKLRGESSLVGLVPTMGALHEGHLSLVRASRKRCGQTIATIFLNPAQFGPEEDLQRYPRMPERVFRIVACGFAIWSGDDVDPKLRAKFDEARIPVAGVRQVRIWGVQVDDERELPGHERTQIPDEEVWEINLEAKDGSKYEFDSKLLVPAEG